MPRRKAKDANKKLIWKVALYIRLSREDGREVSLSVVNQRQILMKHLESFDEEYNLADIYIDDGYTGTDSDRKDFQRLLDDIKTGQVNCVIVKDLSRLSRNYSEAGYYLENYFVNHNVRFISLDLPALDSYKYPEQMNSLIVPIQNVINDDFCRQTSIKIRGVLNAKRSNGEFIGAFAPYGYKKDPNNRHKLIIDEEAAEVVRDIYLWFVNDGISKGGIARKLTNLGVSTPSDYKKRNGFKYQNSTERYLDSHWSTTAVKDILNNKMYLGHMIQGRYRIKSYKIHKSIRPPEEEWFIVENTHEPIISQDIYDKAQELQLRDTRASSSKGTLHLFSGFVRCADCDRPLHRKSSKKTAYLTCRQYNDVKKCTKHVIREDILEQAVFEAVRKQIAFVFNLQEIIDQINRMSNINKQSKRLDDMLKSQSEKLHNAVEISDALYIDWKNGDISQEEYKRMKSNYAEKIEQLKKSVSEIERERESFSSGVTPNNSCFEQFCKHKNITELTRDILVEFIDIILLHENKEITIKFKFEDQFENILDFIENNQEKSCV